MTTDSNEPVTGKSKASLTIKASWHGDIPPLATLLTSVRSGLGLVMLVSALVRFLPDACAGTLARQHGVQWARSCPWWWLAIEAAVIAAICLAFDGISVLRYGHGLDRFKKEKHVQQDSATTSDSDPAASLSTNQNTGVDANGAKQADLS